MIHVVAVLTAKIGHRAALLAALRSVVPAVRAEPVVDTDHSPDKFGADTLVVIETWRDEDALESHNEGAPLAEFHEKAKHILAQADIYVLREP
jgi:quinol monooxygenase YgiN